MFPANTKDDNVRTLKNTAQSIKDDATDKAQDVKEDIRDTANRAGRRVRSFLDNASDELSSATETVSGQIKDNPVQATLIALGAGFILGMLYRR